VAVTRIRSVLVVGACWFLCGVPALRGQESLTRIGPKTEVRSISFRFEDKNDLREDDLRTRISLTPQGSMVGLRRFFGFLPFVPPVGAHPFDPLELQRDVIRLRNRFHRAGYPKAQVKYDVTYHSKQDVVDVGFVIRAGSPLMVDSLDFVGDSGPLDIPPEARDDWATFVKRERKNAERLGEDERKSLADSTWRWFSAHGYPFAQARTIVAVDTAANTADVTVQARPDIRARVRLVEVKGNKTAPPHHYARQLPVSRGRWFDGAALERGREQLTQMDLVRLALVDVPRDEARDSTVAVRLAVTENPPHLIRGEVGIQSGGGLFTQTDWTDRSVFNGLRTLTLTGIAQTGLLALQTPSEQLYRLSLTLFQPYVGTRTLSAAGGPFGEYRDDIRDRSLAAGFEGSLVYAPSQVRSLSLGYSISHRRIYNFGFGENLDPSVYLPLLGLATPAGAGTLESTRNRSVVSLQGSYGRLDRIADPRKGYVLRPRVEITTPFFNTSEYLVLDMSAAAFVPLTQKVGFTFRAGAGRIFPYGNSLDNVGSESPFVSLFRLRDVTFTAGGSRDVRGWGSQLVGPKLPEVKFESGSGGTVDTVADRYAPVGGLARLVGSAELQVPLPGFGEAWRGFLFLDAGKIWTPDSRFALNAGELDQDKIYAAVGAGVGYTTVVGALQIAVGYKLNPSPLDLRSSQDVLRALSSGNPIDPLPTSGRRRLHLHFSIGSTF
jgi:outer membrane protein insertion porin family